MADARRIEISDKCVDGLECGRLLKQKRKQHFPVGANFVSLIELVLVAKPCPHECRLVAEIFDDEIQGVIFPRRGCLPAWPAYRYYPPAKHVGDGSLPVHVGKNLGGIEAISGIEKADIFPVCLFQPLVHGIVNAGIPFADPV